MSARPTCSVRKFDSDAVVETMPMPAVFLAPIRTDIVHYVHSNMAKNARQPYAVSASAGMQHSAESWGTGRAVARIPRVSGGGTSRAGQGAFGNQCRKGRMFAPTKVWRRWHRKINVNQKRFAVASALAASAIPSLVMARGHRIEQVPEVPLIVEDSFSDVKKTREALKGLTTLGLADDLLKVKKSKKVRAGTGKYRNRRTRSSRSLLIVTHNREANLTKAVRNLPGVEVSSVNSLNLLQLAPGGHVGRLCLFTRSAFKELNNVFGSTTRESTQKVGYFLPRSIMANSDVTRLINSDEIQSKLLPSKSAVSLPKQKKNPLKNLGAMVKLNPYALAAKRLEIQAHQRRANNRLNAVELARAKAVKAAAKKQDAQSKKNYTRLVSDEGIATAAKEQDEEVLVIKGVQQQKKKKKSEKVVEEEVVEVKDDKKGKGKVVEKKEEKKDAKKK